MSHSLRQATIEDLPQILDELKEFAKFYKSKISLFKDQETSEKIITSFIKEHLFIVAHNGNGDFCGFISGMVLPHIYNPDIVTLVESFWWVKPEHRGTKAGALLLNAFIDFGKEHVDWIIATIEDDSPVNEDVFLKRGFRLKEKSYLMEVN